MTKYRLSKGTSIEASRSPLARLDFRCPFNLHVIHSCIQRAILIAPPCTLSQWDYGSGKYSRGQYGIERLCEVVRLHWQQSAPQIKAAVIDDLRRHIGEQNVFDDITLLVLKQK